MYEEGPPRLKNPKVFPDWVINMMKVKALEERVKELEAENAELNRALNDWNFYHGDN